MEIIEKDGTSIRSHEDCYYDRCYHNGYWDHDRYASKGVAGAGLGLGIAGTALGLLNLFGNRGVLGGSGMPENININGIGGTGSYGAAPTAFGAWEKECQDALALTNEMWGLKVGTLNQMYAHRDIDINEKFQLWKSQVDADFGLYKSTRDGFDALASRISDLETKVAVSAAVRPYQDKLLQCQINEAHNDSINYTDRKTCKAIYGQVVLASTPTVTGYAGANQCGCPTVIASSATA